MKDGLRERLAALGARLEAFQPLELQGEVQEVVGLLIVSRGPAVAVGDAVRIVPEGGGAEVLAEVVGFRRGAVLLMPLGDLGAVGPGARVRPAGGPLSVVVGETLVGRVLDGLGRPQDGGAPIRSERRPVFRPPPPPLARPPIRAPLPVGIRAIDGLLTVGRGQRMGIFAGSGVGKSTLLGMIARGTAADVNVIALIGERSREVREFLERDLGEAGRRRSVVVAVPSDQPALLRMKGAYVATAIAEYFRDRGLDVLLMMDSLTRFAHAAREVGLASGEPPTTKGYPPSVFGLLPKLLERAGTSERGSITAFYTVLVDGDDLTDPIADAVRGLLDGHIVLSRALAQRGHFPAIDVLESTSRVMRAIVPPEQLHLATRFRELAAVYRQSEDLIAIGAYRRGQNARLDESLKRKEAMDAFLRQDVDERAAPEETLSALQAVFAD
ncbi:FliI/YscN family ATPase [Hydrogenibacillus sp. N12]|uniref:FliI/YscN family ATPase n=1 Tax=Hydrogenibacillus sp. N12 TaxID=2866627 RepID=UPI001C7CE942|nr:FliI/YscN family ATPase [Hydrogenibacillus sp. N12]QZA33501.1 FliI/YscN family ATPase [Hydrogenibacillus sp. N12]